MIPLQSWGRTSALPHDVVDADMPDRVAKQLAGMKGFVARGMGRSYGDAALNGFGVVFNTLTLSRFVEFDQRTGVIEVEAGVVLQQLATVARRHGWHLPVVPGTAHVSVGGAIAADVHGKNHHRRGTFSRHVVSLVLARSDGSLQRCSRDENAELFRATVGGLGLTGVIVKARIRLAPGTASWIEAENIAFENVDEFFQLSAASRLYEHSVAWVDCVGRKAGRGIFERGRVLSRTDNSPARRERVAPPLFGAPVVNSTSVALFNAGYYALKRRRRAPAVIPADEFLYPLDAVLGWNRLYGKAGFYQYQCVVPQGCQREAIRELLRIVAQSGQGSMLAVLKSFGEFPAEGVLSFARPGTTLALDFPNLGSETMALFDRLDAVVVEACGAVYGAKDGRMPGELFRRGYPEWADAWAWRDPGVKSSLLTRVFGDVE